MRAWHVLMLTVAAMWVGGCVRSVQPFLKDDQAIVDPSLAGNWVSADGKTRAEVTAPDKDSKNYKVVYYDEKGKPLHLVMELGKVDNVMLVDLVVAGPILNTDESDLEAAFLMPLHSFLIITPTATKLTASMMGQDWLKEYLDQHPGELATITLKSDETPFILNSSTEDLQKFILKHRKDERAMGDPGVFVRPGDPSTRPTTKPN